MLWRLAHGRQGFTVILAITTILTTTLQVTGFALSQVDVEKAEYLFLLGSCMFQWFAALAVHCIYLLEAQNSQKRIIAFTTTFLLAAIGIVISLLSVEAEYWLLVSEYPRGQFYMLTKTG